MLEYAMHLHEHFVDPIEIRDGHYVAPLAPGYSITMKEESLRDYSFPHGPVWGLAHK